MTKTTILVASSSPINRGRIAKLVAAVPEFEVIAVTADLSETFTKAEELAPDLVVLSDEFLQYDEFDSMKSLFKALGARWITTDAGVHPPLANASAGEALAGKSEARLDLTMSPDAVRDQIRKIMALPRAYTGRPLPVVGPAAPVKYERMVVIGSSTGGVDALLMLLSGFPEDCPPTAIVQHTGKGFSDSLTQVLDRRSKPRVIGAQTGLELRRGTVCVAGGTGGHMLFDAGNPPRCEVRQGPAVSGHVPSVDALFRSVLPLAPRVVGVILTGMGQDGAAGLLELRQAGCATIGQDEATSVVYGMPRAAWEIGAVQTQLPIHKIAAEILRICAQPLSPQAAFGRRTALR